MRGARNPSTSLDSLISALAFLLFFAVIVDFSPFYVYIMI